MQGKIDAFYGAEVFGDTGRPIGRIGHKTYVTVIEHGCPANHDGEWLKIDSGDNAGWRTGWVRASQVEAPVEQS